MVINMLKGYPFKSDIAGKRKGAAWNDKFRAKVLFV
jgi:hypothetical protein